MIASFSRPAVIPVFSLVLILPGHDVQATEYISPVSIDGAVTIDAEHLIELVGSRADTVLIDSRIHADHMDSYIDGSQHLVDREINCETLARLLSGKETPVSFYCNGMNGDRSDKAAVIAIGCGYHEVYWFRGGIEEWRAGKYPLIQ